MLRISPNPDISKRSRFLFHATLVISLVLGTEVASSRDQAREQAGEVLQQARSLAQADKVSEAMKLLEDSIKNESDKLKRGERRLALGILSFDHGRIPQAETELQKAIEDGLRVEDYAYFYLGLIKLRSGRSAEARTDFGRVIGSRAPAPTQLEARYHISESFVLEKNWKAAILYLEPLRRQWRSNELYPAVLFNLLQAQLETGSKAKACANARELYSKYPTHPRVHDWNATLEKNAIGGKAIPCSATVPDLQTRIRRLQLGGEGERAMVEIKALKQGVKADSYEIDALLANHLISEGQTDEAMKILLKHYEAQKSRPGFLLLMGKAASRAGDYGSAVGLYQRAYELAPRARASANALFQAAFTAYQMQDYDGASRRFDKFVRAFPGSKLARDSQWHLAWIRYLRADYSGAIESLQKIASTPKPKLRRGRRKAVAADSISMDRVRYWTAMSHLRLGQAEQAVPLFQQLVRDPAIGYYAIASYYRLSTIPGAKVPPGVEVRLGLRKAEAGAIIPTEEEMQAAVEVEEEADTEQAATEPVGEIEVADENGAGDTEGERASAEELLPGLGDVILSRRFERARQLSAVGLEEAAQRELVDVERRARSSNERKLLMSEYQLVRNFHRSSYIGEVGFGGVRLKNGLLGEGKPLWEFAYPRAYDGAVTEVAKTTSVPQEFIWGIMRAESHFRHDARSAVGALGLMQIMPFTGRQLAQLMNWRDFQAGALLVPENNIRLGTRYLQRLLEKFSGSIPLAAAGYNAGPHRVHAWVRNFGVLDMDEFVEHIPYVETRNYVKKVVRNYEIYSLLYSGGAHSARWLPKPVGVKVDDKIPTREVW